MAEEKRESKRKTNKSPWKHSVQEKRRADAEARNVVYQKLSPQERLLRLDRAGLTATRERAKIQKLLKG